MGNFMKKRKLLSVAVVAALSQSAIAYAADAYNNYQIITTPLIKGDYQYDKNTILNGGINMSGGAILI